MILYSQLSHNKERENSMQQNILKASNVTKIFMIYNDGKNIRRKELVNIRYMDNNHCYFVGSTIANYSKPKWRAKTDIIVYTPDGIYSANVIIRDTTFTLQELMYKVDIPKTWKFTQLRGGTRKKIKLPVTINFTDGSEINTTTYDIAIGGFSILSKQDLSTVQIKFPCSCNIKFPNDTLINFPDGTLETATKYIRQKPILDDFELKDHKLFCFKFTNLNPNESMILKNFLMKIE